MYGTKFPKFSCKHSQEHVYHNYYLRVWLLNPLMCYTLPKLPSKFEAEKQREKETKNQISPINSASLN